ncbi:hypothetical protein NPS01_31150 [Nocardioides psychrotolerans]|nr:hypothetical protein NPS01_31150 [Nocardioides psychrotolerans]
MRGLGHPRSSSARDPHDRGHDLSGRQHIGVLADPALVQAAGDDGPLEGEASSRELSLVSTLPCPVPPRPRAPCPRAPAPPVPKVPCRADDRPCRDPPPSATVMLEAPGSRSRASESRHLGLPPQQRGSAMTADV